MRFGSVDTFLSLRRDDLRIGRQVANHEFLRALLTYGTFDEYWLFLPDLAHREVLRQSLLTLLPDAFLRKRVKLTVQVALREVLEDLEFTVFHQSDFTRHLPYLAPYRDVHGKNRFPLTGITHSLNTYLMAQRYLQLGLARLAPYDAILCTSLAGSRVVAQGFALMRERLRDEFGLDLSLNARLEHLPLGIEDERFTTMDPHAARAALGIHETSSVILALGRLSSRSKMDLLPFLQSFARRIGEGRLHDTLLLIAGNPEGDELERLKQAVALLNLDSRVRFITPFEETDKSLLYSAATAFVSLADNLQETFGLVILEAMAAGLAPVVSDFDGYRELVAHGQTGFLVPTIWGPGVPSVEGLEAVLTNVSDLFQAQVTSVDVDAALLALERLCRDAPLRSRMGAAARAHAQAYRWSALIPRYEKLWTDLAAEAARTPRPSPRPPFALIGAPLETFRHYPSLTLTPLEVLKLAAEGRDVLSGAPMPKAPADFAVVLFTPLLEALLRSLEAGPQSVSALCDLGVSMGTTAPMVTYHLLWMLKVNLLALNRRVPLAFEAQENSDD